MSQKLQLSLDLNKILPVSTAFSFGACGSQDPNIKFGPMAWFWPVHWKFEYMYCIPIYYLRKCLKCLAVLILRPWRSKDVPGWILGFRPWTFLAKSESFPSNLKNVSSDLSSLLFLNEAVLFQCKRGNRKDKWIRNPKIPHRTSFDLKLKFTILKTNFVG